MKQLLKIFTLSTLLFMVSLSFKCRAQQAVTIQDHEVPIFIVVLVLATIFAGIIAFLIYLDLKLRKLERSSKK